MALCPKCYGILNFWNVKAECPYCGTNIPNHNWEERLDEDAANAEIAWKKFRKFTGNFKSALFGNKLRVIRFICTFIPLVALVLPLARYTLNIPFVDSAAQNMTLLDFTLNTFLTLNWGSLFGFAGSATLGAPVLMLMIAVLCLYLAVVFGVLNFLMVLIKAPSLKAGANVVLCVGSAVCFIAAGVLFTLATVQAGSNSVEFISGSVQYGLFVGIALFTLNVVLNTLINKSFKAQRLEQANEEE
ncbi:MAG: hypothetical protein IKV44_02300 [Clostridia bacterium]|nr:hypothetical protein [Clostridia bacterium]